MPCLFWIDGQATARRALSGVLSIRRLSGRGVALDVQLAGGSVSIKSGSRKCCTAFGHYVAYIITTTQVHTHTRTYIHTYIHIYILFMAIVFESHANSSCMQLLQVSQVLLVSSSARAPLPQASLRRFLLLLFSIIAIVIALAPLHLLWHCGLCASSKLPLPCSHFGISAIWAAACHKINTPHAVATRFLCRNSIALNCAKGL